ncbi:MAG: NfeD family protein [Prevotellaceae bacterium]|nr:NfeD family protein [Prevotellaceae bacterium]
MNILTDWFAQIDPAIRAYWMIAIAASAVFLVQMVMTFIGIGDADGIDGDFDMCGDADGGTLDAGGTLQLFSVRNIVNFLLGAGWGGVCLSSTITNSVVLCFAALLTGCVFVAVFAFIYKQMRHLEHDGAFRIEECLGQVADVYLRIPAGRNGEGRIQYSFQGSVQELPAVTDGDQIPSGAKVRVVEIIGDHTLLVEKI